MSAIIKTESADNLKILSFTADQFKQLRWTEENKEVNVNGVMYDVARVEMVGNSVNLYVEGDATETDLIAGFINNVQQPERDQANSPAKLLLEHFLKEFTTVGYLSFYSPSTEMTRVIPGVPVFTSALIDRLQSPPPRFTA
ncbi:MAG: hypothetical protein JWO06_339 [Bacteroidota bacterium]|nr:hypothetical protein [Bacteroidota bacterium]